MTPHDQWRWGRNRTRHRAKLKHWRGLWRHCPETPRQCLVSGHPLVFLRQSFRCHRIKLPAPGATANPAPGGQPSLDRPAAGHVQRPDEYGLGTPSTWQAFANSAYQPTGHRRWQAPAKQPVAVLSVRSIVPPPATGAVHCASRPVLSGGSLPNYQSVPLAPGPDCW